MFKLMRNTHLALGLTFFLMAVVFAVSSAVIIYRPWFPNEKQETEETVALSQGASPRDAALELMRNHGVRGDLRNIKTEGDVSAFDVNRPGTQVNIVYSSSSGTAKLTSRRFNFYETLVQLHVNHGFWHDYLPSNVWAVLSLAASIALFLIGATGIYLWYVNRKERTIGYVLICFGFVVPLAALVLTRVQ